jgi:hypothetical protein
MENKISYKVCTNFEFLNHPKPSIFYKIICGCGGDCYLDLELEYDPEINSIELYFYKEISARDYDNTYNIFKRFFWRIKTALKILFKGTIFMDGNLLIQEEKHINDFIYVLQEGQKKIKEFSKDEETKKEN